MESKKGGVLVKTAKKRKMLNDLFDLNRKIMIGELGYLPSVVEAISKIIEENGGYDLEQPEAKSIIKELKCENMDGKTPEDEITKNKTAKMAIISNFLTTLMNFRGTQNPSWQNVDITKIISKYLKKE